MIPVALATEDALSEAIGLRLLSELTTPIQPTHILRKGGFGYLRSKMDSWRQMSDHLIMFVLTDLDRANCVVEFRQQWLGLQKAPANLLLRMAVKEIESWVLADHVALRSLIGPKGVLPPSPDGLPDPKRFLLQLAKQAPKGIREDLIRMDGQVAKQGLGYNNRLTMWVHSDWSPARASERSPSLARARKRLQEAAQAWAA